ncbi:MAG: hypothetical protein WCF85_02500 [Rhodospirillaceae bacterium]
MRTLFAAVLMGLIVAVPLGAGAQTHAPAAKTDSRAYYTLNRDLALVGGGVLGLVLASGLINLGFAGAMMLETGAIVDSLEAGASLPLPLALLAGGLGAMFGQDLVYNNLPTITISPPAGERAKAGH